VGTILLLVSITMPLIIISGCIIGIATATFLASNWAMGTDIAPKQDVGRYLGMTKLAGAGAGIVGAGICDPIADFFKTLHPGFGYLIIFGIFAMPFLLSTAARITVKVGQ
jgi:MFS family permease